MSNKLGVALTKEVCPVCCQEFDGSIVMNTRLTEPEAKKVEEMHGKVLGFMEHPCTECREKMPEGTGTWLIVVDGDKTEDQRNLYRTGELFGLKREASERIFNVPYSEVAFIDYRDAQTIGLEIKYQG